MNHTDRLYHYNKPEKSIPKTPRNKSSKRHRTLPRRSFANTRIPTLPTHATQRQRLQGIRFPAPDPVLALALLKGRDPEVRHGRTDDHACTENE